MKKWVRPLTEVQNFVANEYVAACGDSGTTYKFTCNAPGLFSGLKYKFDSEGNPTIASGLNLWNPCYGEFEVESTEIDTDAFTPGFVDRNANGKYDEGTDTGIYIYMGGPHVTTNVNKEDWETGKS